LNLPWPIAARDILLERRFKFDLALKQVTASYRSISDSRYPEVEGIIRAMSPHTMWRFTVVAQEEEEKEHGAGDAIGALAKPPDAGTSGGVVSRRGLGRWRATVRDAIARCRQALMRVFGGFFRGPAPAAAPPQRSLQHRSAEHCTSLHRGSGRSSKVLVEVESSVNSRGSIPAWFINYMQRCALSMHAAPMP
jgi:hypothetical protein